MKTVIIDTNIVLASLRSKFSTLRDKITNETYRFYAPKFLFVEIFKHKERILKNSTASEEDILEFLSSILHYIYFINEDLISTETYLKAYNLCKEVDENDTIFVALSLTLDCPIWTRDEVLKEGLKAKGFSNFLDEENF
jgi:predicted nucleic acid-binding protein